MKSLTIQGILLDEVSTILHDAPYLALARSSTTLGPSARAALLHQWLKATIDLVELSHVYDNPTEAHRRALCFDGGPESFWDYGVTGIAYEVWRELIDRRAAEGQLPCLFELTFRMWHLGYKVSLCDLIKADER